MPNIVSLELLGSIPPLLNLFLCYTAPVEVKLPPPRSKKSGKKRKSEQEDQSPKVCAWSVCLLSDKNRVNSILVENVVAMSMPNIPFEAIWVAIEVGIVLIIVDDGIAIVVAGAIM